MNGLRLKTVTSIFLLVWGTSTYSSKPTFSLTPLTETRIQVPPNTSGNVQYLVTNNTKISRTLTMIPISGVQQLTQGIKPGFNLCTNPFT